MQDEKFKTAEAQPFFFPGDDHGVLLIHGFTGSAGHMRLLGEHLRDAGFTVRGINLPGHALSMDDMARTGWNDWLSAAKDAVVELRKTCKYVSVCGLSMGGVITLLLAEQMELTSIATISAPMAVLNPLMPFARILAPLMPRFMWGTSDEKKSQLDERYNLGYAGFPTRTAADLSRLIKMARRDLSAVVCPILVVQSHGDETIAPSSADVIMMGVSSQRKATLWLDKVPHVCTISCEHQRIGNRIASAFRLAQE